MRLKQKKRGHTNKMKRLMIAIAAAASIACLAATHEENVALAATELAKVTKDNVQAVSEACVAVTNYNRLFEFKKAGLIDYTQICGYLDGRLDACNQRAYAAGVSSNDTLIASVATAIVKEMIAEGKDNNVKPGLALYLYLQGPRIPQATRTELVKAFIEAKMPINAICLGYRCWDSMWNRKVKTLGWAGYDVTTYGAFLQENIDSLYAGWLAVEPTEGANPWDEGFDIVKFKIERDGDIDSAAIAKAVKYGRSLHRIRYWLSRQPVAKLDIACGKAYIALSKEQGFSDGYAIKFSKQLDWRLGNKDATKSIIGKLTNQAIKFDAILYVDDKDALIDACKVIDTSIDAKMLEKIIIALNSIDAGYRTDDLKLALKNINKKYTIKLYDDRDTWEPIVSKVRAMIDTL